MAVSGPAFAEKIHFNNNSLMKLGDARATGDNREMISP
jgi:hypothetical protein